MIQPKMIFLPRQPHAVKECVAFSWNLTRLKLIWRKLGKLDDFSRRQNCERLFWKAMDIDRNSGWRKGKRSSMSPSDQKLFLIFVIVMVDSLFLLLIFSGWICDVDVDGPGVLPTLELHLGVWPSYSSHSLSCYHDMNLPWYAWYDCISAHLV